MSPKEPLKQKGRLPSLALTTHNRVLNETSLGANQLAIRWDCSKLEVYRWLVKMALEGKAVPDEVKSK